MTVKQYKVDAVNVLIEKLKEKQNIVLTNFTGVKVKELNALRRNLNEQGADYKVVKNNLFKRALNDAGYVDVEEYLKGPIAVAFTDNDLSEVARTLKTFKKEQKTFGFSIGIMENVIYNEDQVKKIADLPSLDVLRAQVMSLVNGPATNVASGMKQVMASLARGINSVAEKNNS